VKVRGQTRPPSGSERIQNQDDAEYVLEATSDGGTVKKSIGVIVLRPPEIEDLSASAPSVDPGKPVTLQLEYQARRAR
jgi:hypothetical protein